MTDSSKKDSSSPAAPPTAPESVKVEAPVPAEPPPAAPGLGSFRIGVRGAMRPPTSIPVVQPTTKPEQEGAGHEEPAPQPIEAPSPRARAGKPLAPRTRAAAKTLRSDSQRPVTASAPAASSTRPAPAPEAASQRAVAAKPAPATPPAAAAPAAPSKPRTAPATSSAPRAAADPLPAPSLTPATATQAPAATAPAMPASPPPEAVSPSTLARIRQAQRLAQKEQASTAPKDTRAAPRAKTPLKRPWSKLNALAHKKQKAEKAGLSQAKPAPPKKRKP